MDPVDGLDSENVTIKNKKIKSTTSEDTNKHIYDKDGDVILDRPTHPFLSCSNKTLLDDKISCCDSSDLTNDSHKDIEVCYINISKY